MTGTVAIRVKATRPTYRRAGLVFGSADWTEILPGEVEGEAVVRLLADPVLLIEFRPSPDADWQRVPASDRDHAAELVAGFDPSAWTLPGVERIGEAVQQNTQREPGSAAAPATAGSEGPSAPSATAGADTASTAGSEGQRAPDGGDEGGGAAPAPAAAQEPAASGAQPVVESGPKPAAKTKSAKPARSKA